MHTYGAASGLCSEEGHSAFTGKVTEQELKQHLHIRGNRLLRGLQPGPQATGGESGSWTTTDVARSDYNPNRNVAVPCQGLQGWMASSVGMLVISVENAEKPSKVISNQDGRKNCTTGGRASMKRKTTVSLPPFLFHTSA
jgi:hypothetical protein